MIVAPFTGFTDDGEVDLSKVRLQKKFYKDNGIVGAFICGTTGEGSSLTMSERKLLFEEWAKYKDIVQEEDLDAVKKLGVILRIAESLDRSMSGVIKGINCDVLGDSVIMKTEVDGDATLEIRDAMNANTEFKRAFRKNLEIL